MKQNLTAPFDITGLSHEGRGIGHIDGKTIFVDNALPSETITAQIRRRKSRYNEAMAIDIVKASPERISPHCQYFGVCGGCSLQHMKPEAQLLLKQDTVANLLLHQAQLSSIQWLTPLSGPSYHYRRKARLSVKYVEKKQKVLVGFRERQGRYVADIEQCAILPLHVGQHLAKWADMIMNLSIKKSIPQIEVAVADNQTALIIRHLEPFAEADFSILKDFACQYDYHLYLQPKGEDSIHLFYPNTQRHLHYAIPQHHIELMYQPTHFTQVNQDINLKMINQALKLLELTQDDKVIDLFCGIGNFTLPIARYCAHVTGVEGAHSAIEQANINANLNEISNCTFFTANLFEQDYQQEWSKSHYNKVLLDPPRAGAAEIIPLILTWQPERIVYISCNPATLARDLKLLTATDYQVECCGIMDMFPQTKHTETMVALTRAPK